MPFQRTKIKLLLVRIMRSMLSVCLSLFWRLILISLIVSSVGTVYNEKMAYIKHTLPGWTKIIVIPAEVVLIISILVNFYLSKKEKLRGIFTAPLSQAEQAAAGEWIQEELANPYYPQNTVPEQPRNSSGRSLWNIAACLILFIPLSIMLHGFISDAKNEIAFRENVLRTYDHCELMPSNIERETYDIYDEDGDYTETYYTFDYSYTYNGTEYTGSITTDEYFVTENKAIEILVNPNDPNEWYNISRIDNIDTYETTIRICKIVWISFTSYILFVGILRNILRRRRRR